MKRSKIALGICALLLAAGGAFASAKAYAPNTYFYMSNSGLCLQIEVDKDCEIGGTDCTEIVGSGPAKQLFRDKISSTECDVELQVEQ